MNIKHMNIKVVNKCNKELSESTTAKRNKNLLEQLPNVNNHYF